MKADLGPASSDVPGRWGFRGVEWRRAIGVGALLIGIFGIFLPWEKGGGFLDSVILGAYACLGIVFAAPMAASALEENPTIGQALARVGISVLYGELIAGMLLLLGLLTVFTTRAGRIVVGPDLGSLAECALFGLALSLALSAAAVWCSVRFSPNISRTMVRIVFIGLLAAFYLRSGWLPAVALRGAGIALLVSILFLAALPFTLARPKENRTA